MMEIWIRSIARAGGVEMPASARVLPGRERRPATSLRPALAQGLKRLGGYLVKAGDRLCGEVNTAAGRC